MSAGSDYILRHGELKDVVDTMEYEALDPHTTRLLFLNLIERIGRQQQQIDALLEPLKFRGDET